MNEKICLICLENINDIEKVIEYNHCGIYYIHNECLNNWNHNECIICRKKFVDFIDSSNDNLQNNNNTTILNTGNESISSDIIDVMSNSHIRQSHRYKTIACSMLMMFILLFTGSCFIIETVNNKK